MSSEIKAAKKEIKSIFSDFWFLVPGYQRSYVWETDNIQDLLDDLWFAYENKPENEYFLGSLVLKKTNKEDFNEYEVLDGQQRLTTFFLLMAVLRDISEDERLKGVCQNRIYQEANPYEGTPERLRIVYEIRDNVEGFIKEYILEKGGTLNPKIEENIKSDNTSISHMANAINEMKSFFSDKETKQIEGFGVFLALKLIFIYVSTESREDAFRMFTILNNRGIPLTSADILKSTNIGAIPTIKEQEKYAKKWEGIEGNLGKDFDRFLSFIRTVLVKDKARLNLLDEFEKNIYEKEWEEKGITKKGLLERGKETIDFIERYYDIYDKTILEPKLSSNEYNNLITIMNIGLPSSDWIPPVLLFTDKFRENRLPDFLRKLELKFTSDWLSQYTSTERIKNMNEILKEIEKEGQTVDNLLNNKELFKISKENFENALNRKDFYKKKYAKYILLKYDFLKSSNTALISNYRNISIEHILPQNPDENSQWQRDFTENEIEDLKHNLGNLILINGKKNTSLGNLDFILKKERYLKKRIDIFPSGKVFLQETEWKPQSIKDRQKEMIDTLLKEGIFD
ncbi:DUF262 domain-containing protein [Capnocytophaga sp. 051621]|jgi:hypothetical protein|uniref:DUF262 domain-containing protein n=1 Tax=Capnocytophaga periodontitidis TaxID=2795027 RepID=A0ABS0SJS8_9FLAO|nr:DUF262 domain-containing protein [Capnocytophaga periodontitidis]MBI1646016.1 DUF262 domain-containing protein [Capnocytophaga periodontitidis]